MRVVYKLLVLVILSGEFCCTTLVDNSTPGMFVGTWVVCISKLPVERNCWEPSIDCWLVVNKLLDEKVKTSVLTSTIGVKLVWVPLYTVP